MAMMACKECGNQVSSKSANCPQCGIEIKKKTNFGCGTAILIFISVLFFLSYLGMDNVSQTTPRPPSPKEIALDSVDLKFSWKTGGFGSVMEADFTISNNGDLDIKDIKIKCSHYSKSKTLIDSNSRTIYEVVEAKTQKQYLDFNMGFVHDQINSSSCSIINLVVL